MINCTVGVMAYNEEQNIVQALQAVIGQRLSSCRIAELIVVASGCTDRTVELAQQVARSHPIVKVEAQAERLGKASAINHLLSIAHSEVIVLVGADTLPDPNALDQLICPFADPAVGMTGAQVVPLNDPRTFLGMTTHILWRVHHRMARRWPKLGELVAFRNLPLEIPANTATDEVALEALISARGYRLIYVPDAVVYNRGPQTLDDFVIQRRRIFAGHLHIAKEYGYIAPSMQLSHLIVLAAEAFSHYSFLLPLTAGAIALEIWARLLGTLDFWLGHSHHIWRPAPSTKRLRQNRQSLTLVVVQCARGSINPAHLVWSMRRIPASRGVLFWWYQRHSQLLFILPDEAGDTTLDDQVKTLAADIGHSAMTVLSYRVVQFNASLS